MGAKPSSSEATHRSPYPADPWLPSPSVPPPASDPRPSDSLVLAEFREKLNSLPLTSDQKLILQEQSVDIKHKLLCKLRELQTEGVAGKDAAQILHIIQSSPTQRSFRQLLKWLKSAEDNLIADFIASEGIDVLVNMLIVSQELARNTQNYEKQTLLLQALAHLNTYEDGTLELISDEMKVVYIALSLSIEEEASSVLTVDLMVDLCWYSSEGYEVVTKSMEVLALERGLESAWVFFIEVLRSKSCKFCYKYKVMTLLNTMIQSALEPEVQVQTRGKLISLGLSSTLQTLKSDIEETAPARRRNIRPFQLQAKHHRLAIKEKATASSKAKKTALQVFDPDNTDDMARSRDRHRRSDHLVRPSEDLLDAKVNEIIHSTIDVSAISAFVQRQGEAEENGEDLSDEDYALALLDQIQLFEEEENMKEETEKTAIAPENLLKAVEQAARASGALDLLTDTFTSLLQLPCNHEGRQAWTVLKETSLKLGKGLPIEEDIQRKLMQEQRNELEAMRKSIEDLGKSLEERDREIDNLWGKKKKWMAKKVAVKKELEELRRNEAVLKNREGEASGKLDIKKEQHLALQKVESIRLLGRPTEQITPVLLSPNPSLPAAPTLSSVVPQAIIPPAPVLNTSGVSPQGGIMAPQPPAPVLTLPNGNVPAAPSLVVPVAPQISLPNSAPTAPALSLNPTAPALNLPVTSSTPIAPSLSLTTLAPLRPAAPLLPTVTPIGLSQPTQITSPPAPILAPSAPALSLPGKGNSVPAAPLLPTVTPVAPMLSIPSGSAVPTAPTIPLLLGTSVPLAPMLPVMGTPAAPTLTISNTAPKANPVPLTPTVTPVAPVLSLSTPSAPQAPALLIPTVTPVAPTLSLSTPSVPRAPVLLTPTVTPVAPTLSLPTLSVPQAPTLGPSAPSLSLPTGKGSVPVAPLLPTVTPIGLAQSSIPPAPQLPSLSIGQAPMAPSLSILLAPSLALNSAPAAPSLTIPSAPRLPSAPSLSIPSAPQLSSLSSSAPAAPSLPIPLAPSLLSAAQPIAPSLSLPNASPLPQAPNLTLLVGNPNATPIAPSLSGLSVPSAPNLPSAPVLGAPSAPSLGRPQAPNLSSVPGPPNLGIFATAPVVPSLPPKEKRKPAAPMKSIFWTPITVQKVTSSVWNQVDDSKIPIDEESLLSLFAQKKAPPKAAVAETPVEQKVSKISLYPKERSQNVQLLLGKLRMSNAAIVEALLAIDEKILTKGNLITLRAGMPTDEEIAQLQGYEEDPSQLGVTERFFLSLKEVPMPAIRIDAQMFVVNGSEMIEELGEKLRKLEATFNAFQTSSKFKRLLEVVLAMGNYLNGTSSRGGAYGFSLSGLTKVAEMKGQDNKTTLLEYIVQYCFKQYPDLLQLREDFQDLEEASKVPMAQYKVDLSEIEKAYRIVGKATESQSAHPGDHVKAKFEQFEAEFRPLLEKLKARVDALDPKFASFSEFFGTDTKEMPLEGFLTLLYDFVLAFDTAKEKQAKAHAEAERQTRIEARRKAAEQVKSSMLDTAVLIQEIRQKRQQKNVNSGQIQVTAAGKKTTAELHSAVRTRRGTRTSRD